MIKGVSKNMDQTDQEINPNTSHNLTCACVINCVTKYLNAEFKENKYFVNEEKIQLREKPLQGSQT
jgi:hypothetical protein